MRTSSSFRLPLLDDLRRAVRVPSRLALAVVVAAACLGAVSALEPALGRPYFFPAFAGIVLVAVLAGGRYGILTTTLFAVGYVYWYLEPRGSFAVSRALELPAVAAYTVTGCLVAAIGGALRRAYATLRGEHALLERTISQREDLLRALTHDVRSPLNAIGMNAALLAKAEDPAVSRRGRTIQASVAAIDVMLQDLVKVVALESGQVVLERTAVELEPVLHRLRERLSEVLPVDRIELRIPGGLPRLHADPRRLERVLVNLISNALKYSEGPVTVEAAPRDGEVVISVRDLGVGIDRDDVPHVFEKYYRARTAHGREGLGLGLYISRLLVEAHGGRIWVESERGKGSTFFAGIPVAGTAPARAASHDPRPAA